MQVEFTDTEAQAICEMLARLADEGYTVSLRRYKTQWQAYIKEHKYGNIIASGYGFHLTGALNDAWQKVPESEAA